MRHARYVLFGLAWLSGFAVAPAAQAATIRVVNTDDSGPGSLRQAVADAEPGDTIAFDLGACPCTIILTSGEVVVDKSLTIQGPGPATLTIGGTPESRSFRIPRSSRAVISGVAIIGGYADTGGGIRVDAGGSLTLLGVSLAWNRANSGGGVFVDGPEPGDEGGPALTVVDSTFRENDSVDGGGLYALGTVSLVRTDFIANRGAAEGGAVYAAGATRVLGGFIEGNRSSFGAGMSTHAATTVVGTTFANNRGQLGSALFTEGDLALLNSTVSHNVGESTDVVTSSVYVFALRRPVRLRVVNTTIAFNDDGGVSAPYGGTIQIRNSIVSGNARFDTRGTFDVDASNLIGGDPGPILDARLVADGGPPTHALIANSPAIGAGSNEAIAADLLDQDGDGDVDEPLPFDQRGGGHPRVIGSRVDIGAVEADCAVITLEAIPDATVGAAYTRGLVANGGQMPYTFTASGLPAGVSLSSEGLLTGTPTTPGTFIVNVTVLDQGGCGRTLPVTLRVRLPFTGFFAPVNNLPTVNTANAGRAIPIKFSLGGNRGLNILAAGYPQARQVSCNSGGLQDPVEETLTAGNAGLTYDAVTGLYSYVWKTNKAWAGTCWLLTLRLIDGTDHSASFAFR